MTDSWFTILFDEIKYKLDMNLNIFQSQRNDWEM